jgi:hypothetical protein
MVSVWFGQGLPFTWFCTRPGDGDIAREIVHGERANCRKPVKGRVVAFRNQSVSAGFGARILTM